MPIFLNYDTAYTVWAATSEITQSELLNYLFSIVLLSCSIIFLINFRKKIIKFFTSGGDNFDSRKITAFYLTIVFFTAFVSAATLHIGYTINEEDSTLNIHERIADRKAMPTQILMMYGFTLVFSIFPALQFLANRINKKQSLRRENYALEN